MAQIKMQYGIGNRVVKKYLIRNGTIATGYELSTENFFNSATYATQLPTVSPTINGLLISQNVVGTSGTTGMIKFNDEVDLSLYDKLCVEYYSIDRMGNDSRIDFIGKVNGSGEYGNGWVYLITNTGNYPYGITQDLKQTFTLNPTYILSTPQKIALNVYAKSSSNSNYIAAIVKNIWLEKVKE